MSSAYDTLKERGFVQQCSDEEGLRRLLDEGPVTLYTGYDPTGSSLHVGHLVSLQAMAHLQRAGHRPIAVIGGGTARIGDPSFRSEARKLLPIEVIQRNAEAFRRQIARFLDFSHALMVDNAEWLAELKYIEFLRDIGRHFSVNRMLSFETYRMRLETGLSFIEFNYQLLQSYDYLELYRRYGCRLQLGGDDQWGNIVAGIELIRRVERVETYGLTTPLITTADGAKMGKTEKGALYLDAALVSPYEFYQYWINVADADVERFLLLYTFLPLEEVRELTAEGGRSLNRAKEVLAWEVTRTVHGEQEADRAREASRAAFGRGGDAASLDAIPSMHLSETELERGIAVAELFARTGLCSSRGEARRLIQQGGAYVNESAVTDTEAIVDARAVREGTIRLRAGKKRHFIVRVDRGGS